MFEYEIIYVVKPPFVKHEMLLLPNGNVIHNAPTKNVVIEPLMAAVGNRQIHHKEYVRSNLADYQLCAIAQDLRATKKYHFVFYNCQKFLSDLLGQPVKDDQVGNAVILGLMTLVAVAAFKKA